MSNEVATIDAHQNSMMAVIAKAAADPNTDIAKMQALLDMQERIMKKQAEIDFSAAMSRLSGKLAEVKIRRKNSVSYKKGEEAFKFATYEAIDAAIRPLLAEEGFSLSFTSEPRQGDGGGAVITGTLSHAGGALQHRIYGPSSGHFWREKQHSGHGINDQLRQAVHSWNAAEYRDLRGR